MIPGQSYGLILPFKRLLDEPKWCRQKLKMKRRAHIIDLMNAVTLFFSYPMVL